MTGYHDGRRVEYAVVHYFGERGCDVIRAASSKGFADVIAFHPTYVALVSCKRTNPLIPPMERVTLLRVADAGGGRIPLVATKPTRQPLVFRRLTGPGPKEWEPWEAG